MTSPAGPSDDAQRAPTAGGGVGAPPQRRSRQQATSEPSEPRARPAPKLQRFTRSEHWAHRANALLFGTCIATAACLYVGPLAVIVGRRELIKNIHVLAGLLLPVPVVSAWLLSPSFRADVRRLGRFAPRDWEWLRSRDRRTGRVPVGKFNAGQKLNASFVLGSIFVMLGTGIIMRFFKPFPLSWRTGATFVHDWLALFLAVVIIGHIYMAVKDPESLVGMRTGRISRGYALRNHSAWAAELGVVPPDDGEPPPVAEGEERSALDADPVGEP